MVSEFKGEFRLSKNSHFCWIQLNNAIAKAWKENLYKGDKKFHELTFSGKHISKKNQIYSFGKCNSKGLYFLQVSLSDSITTSQAYFEKIFQNKEIEWKCTYLVPRRVTLALTYVYFSIKLRITSYT